MKYIFLINPAAGKGLTHNPLYNTIEKECKEHGIEYEIYFTKGVSNGTEYVTSIAAKYPDEEISFYACGGDGTLGEVVNGVMQAENRERLRVGVIPIGTGNDFVRNFTDHERFLDIKCQVEGDEMQVDLLNCNGTYCVNMINIGFDCEVVFKKEAMQKSAIVPSKLAYVIGLVITLVRKPGIRCQISIDGGEYEEKDLLLTTMGNGEYCGGGFHSNPEADLDNGDINLLTVNNISRTKFISIVNKYKKGTHLVYTDILKSQSAKTVDIRAECNINISIDGEIMTADRGVHVEVAEKAIRFIMPKGIDYIKRNR